ncbi:uncharacterized protein TNCV_1620471 [Trichonephila clavipes]|nr:uncharacterized protein TNCV_1620471 [Trichonephila clavipes]
MVCVPMIYRLQPGSNPQTCAYIGGTLLLSQLADKLQLDIQCGPSSMDVIVRVSTPFRGRVYAAGHPYECYSVSVSDEGRVTLSMPLHGRQCGTRNLMAGVQWHKDSNQRLHNTGHEFPTMTSRLPRPQISGKWDLKLVIKCGMGSEKGKSLILMILIRTIEQNY